MKDEVGRKLLKEFAELRANTYNYLIDNVNEDTMRYITYLNQNSKSLEIEDKMSATAVIN